MFEEMAIESRSIGSWQTPDMDSVFAVHGGFRKIDTDRWEFANESFVRGKKHLLNNISRRRSTMSLHPPHRVTSYPGSSSSSSSETANNSRSVLEGEINKLRHERSALMQEIKELHCQQLETSEHMELLKQRLQTSERRQKQMLSFLVNVVHNPTVFLDRVRRTTTNAQIRRRRFFPHRQELCNAVSSMQGQMTIQYRTDREGMKYDDDPLDVILKTLGEEVGAEPEPEPEPEPETTSSLVVGCQAEPDTTRYTLCIPEELLKEESLSFPTFPCPDIGSLIEEEHEEQQLLNFGSIPAGFWSDDFIPFPYDDVPKEIASSSRGLGSIRHERRAEIEVLPDGDPDSFLDGSSAQDEEIVKMKYVTDPPTSLEADKLYYGSARCESGDDQCIKRRNTGDLDPDPQLSHLHA
ncbi:Heat Stress Transcription Factor [Dionaea muscipula]